MTSKMSVPSVSVRYAQNGSSTRSNELGMRPMQERAYERRGEQYLLIKSPPASGKSQEQWEGGFEPATRIAGLDLPGDFP